MYFEFKGENRRTTWTYTYTGVQLLPYAEERLTFYQGEEDKARELSSRLTLDRSVSPQSDEIAKANQAVVHNGQIHEQLVVWVHEFRRTPDREFQLTLSDVVFFGIHVGYDYMKRPSAAASLA